MNNEEKILELLSRMQGQMDRMQGQMDGMQGQMDGMQGQMDGMQGQMDGMQSQMDRMEARMDRMELDLTSVKVRLEVDVDRGIRLLAEGHEGILEKLVPAERVEKVEDDVVVLKTAVKLHSEEIAELKKAQ